MFSSSFTRKSKDWQGLIRGAGGCNGGKQLLVLGASFQSNVQASSCYKPTLWRECMDVESST